MKTELPSSIGELEPICVACGTVAPGAAVRIESATHTIELGSLSAQKRRQRDRWLPQLPAALPPRANCQGRKSQRPVPAVSIRNIVKLCYADPFLGDNPQHEGRGDIRRARIPYILEKCPDVARLEPGLDVARERVKELRRTAVDYRRSRLDGRDTFKHSLANDKTDSDKDKGTEYREDPGYDPKLLIESAFLPTLPFRYRLFAPGFFPRRRRG